VRKRDKKPSDERWRLVVYLAGDTPVGLSALDNLRRICGEHLDNRVRIEVVDLLKEPETARLEQIVIVPTVVRKSPLPVKRVFGNLMASDLVVRALGMPTSSPTGSQHKDNGD